VSGAIDAQAVAEHFDLGGSPALLGEPDRGELGEVWRLRTTAGQWAVKRCFARQLELDAEQTTGFQSAAIGNGVFAPAPVRARDGRLLADVGTFQLRVYDWVDLAPLDLGLDVTAIGTAVARIHTTAWDGAIADTEPWFSEPITAMEWDLTLEALSCADAPFTQALAAHRDELIDAATLVSEPQALQPCNRDLFAENVRACADGRLCVIDWDNAGLAEPGRELAMVLWEFGRSDAGRAAGLYEAYRRVGGPGRIDSPASFSMMISVASRLLHRSCQLWLDPAGPDERDRRAREVEWWIREPCTRPVVEFLLDAVGD
jgi:Ser/Thr protein kinase RdoA (MazF antagonist)